MIITHSNPTKVPNPLWRHNRQITLAAIPEESQKALKQLLKRNKLFDYFTIAVSWIVLVSFVLISTWFYNNFFSAIIFIIIQGFVIHTVLELIHEYHVHSNTRYAYLNYLSALLAPFSPTLYRKNHFHHHHYFPNEVGDPDIATNTPNTIFEKIMSFTILNDLWLLPTRNKSLGFKFDDGKINYSKKELFKIKIEKKLFWLTLTIAIIAYICGFKQLVLGWLLPLMFGAPIFTGIRVFAEHAHVNYQVPFGCGTNLRLPFLLRITPYASLYGEGHILHHYFPTMPWYHIGTGCALIRPYMPQQIKTSLFKATFKWINHRS